MRILTADEIRNRLAGADTLDALLERLTDEVVQTLGWREWCGNEPASHAPHRLTAAVSYTAPKLKPPTP